MKTTGHKTMTNEEFKTKTEQYLIAKREDREVLKQEVKAEVMQEMVERFKNGLANELMIEVRRELRDEILEERGLADSALASYVNVTVGELQGVRLEVFNTVKSKPNSDRATILAQLNETYNTTRASSSISGRLSELKRMGFIVVTGVKMGEFNKMVETYSVNELLEGE